MEAIAVFLRTVISFICFILYIMEQSVPLMVQQPQSIQSDNDQQSNIQSVTEEDALSESITRLELAIAQDEGKLMEALDKKEVLMKKEPTQEIEREIEVLSVKIKAIKTLLKARAESLEL